MHSPSQPEAVVRQLLQVISRQLPFSVIPTLLSAHLRPHMDGRKIGSGIRSWYRWVRFLQYTADKRMSDLAVAVESINSHDDRVTVTARWSGRINNKTISSDVGTVIYQVQDGKIINIWTHKKNYIFIHGNIAANPLAFYWLLVRLCLWHCPPIDAASDPSE